MQDFYHIGVFAHCSQPAAARQLDSLPGCPHGRLSPTGKQGTLACQAAAQCAVGCQQYRHTASIRPMYTCKQSGQQPFSRYWHSWMRYSCSEATPQSCTMNLCSRVFTRFHGVSEGIRGHNYTGLFACILNSARRQSLVYCLSFAVHSVICTYLTYAGNRGH